jgi:hypothetical protein
LRNTLESLYAVTDQEPQELLIYEDSTTPMPDWLKTDVWRTRNVKWMQGDARRGQCYAIMRLIHAAQFEWIYWLEDDWLHQRQISRFMRRSKEILEKFPDIIQVSLRGSTGWHPLTRDPRFPFLIAEPYWQGKWGGLAWNPGLRRRSDLLKILPDVVAQIGVKGLDHEAQLSKKLLDQGYRIADLGEPLVTHIGGTRSRAIEELPPLPKILIAIPTCFQFEYERWKNASNAHYGVDMHCDGPNDQTQACRETWVRDFAPFKNVTVKFFYGKPAVGYPRAPLSDEVFLECGDKYGDLPMKTVAVCKWAVEQGFEFIYKCDTDTAVYADRLLFELMSNHFDYAGFRHSNVCSGGPGYWLSRHAAKIIAAQGGSSGHVWAEDVHVSRVLANAGIPPLMLPGHRSGMSAHFFFNQGFDPSKLTDDTVTMHAVFPKEMREFYRYLHEARVQEA